MTDASRLARANHDDGEPVAVENLPAALEALLFAAGDPISLSRLADICGQEERVVLEVLEAMEASWAADKGRGLSLRRIKDRWSVSTRPELKPVVSRLFAPRNRPKLTRSAYEALAVIAYNQPVTRAQVEQVRGVNSDSIISRLEQRGYIEVVGQLEAPGRPDLLETTDQFLLEMGLRDVSELPPMELLQYGTLRDLEEAMPADADDLDEDV